MRRSGLVLAAAVALVLSGVALAGTSSYRGTFQGGGTVKFKAKVKKGKPVKVIHSANPQPFGKGFSYGGVPAQCEQGEQDTAGTVPRALKVNRRGKFFYKVTVPQVIGGKKIKNKVTIRGKFANKRKATGTLRFEGALFHGADEIWTNCDTGIARWTAKR